jgi:hypothetical protein
VFPEPSIFSFKRLKWVQMPASQYPYLPDPRSLTGHLPTDLAFSTSLQRLELYGNNFTGGLLMLANLTGLISLDLHFNLFGGPLPDLVKSSDTLEYISFANNQLTGTIPTSYGKLSNLGTLGLASNELGGTLDVVSELTSLEVVYMRNNSFVGPMPSIPQSAAVVDLDDNMLTSFPADVCDKPLPAAYSTPGGCSKDWPVQPYGTCCVRNNNFNCTAPPACLKNCLVCEVQTFKCHNNQCTPAPGGSNKSACEKICG